MQLYLTVFMSSPAWLVPCVNPMLLKVGFFLPFIIFDYVRQVEDECRSGFPLLAAIAAPSAPRYVLISQSNKITSYKFSERDRPKCQVRPLPRITIVIGCPIRCSMSGFQGTKLNPIPSTSMAKRPLASVKLRW